MFLRFITLLFLILLFQNCTTTKNLKRSETTIYTTNWQSEIRQIIDQDSIFKNSHTGLLVRELGQSENTIDIKSTQYFTPASNTKLLTFLTCLKVLGDRVNGLKIYETSDSIIFWGTGDPSFLNPFLVVNDYISERLKNTDKPIYFSASNFQDSRYGSGWSWDDYNSAYQTDKHSLPIYGNLVHFTKPLANSGLKIVPSYFESLIVPNPEDQRTTFIREEHQNLIHYDFNKLARIPNVNRYVPYLTSDELQVHLLATYLGREVTLINQHYGIANAQDIQTVQVDSLYKLLLQPSDNFVAEQLLLNCGSELFDTLNSRKVINWAKKNVLSGMPNDYQWVDGSGLSRYNMTTPTNMVYVLEQIYPLMDRERLFRLLATGGESGTVKNYYGAEVPFVYGKTGSLSNNHSFSGYMIGDSGKTYVFSFMNSNFLVGSRELKGGMDKVLRLLKRNL